MKRLCIAILFCFLIFSFFSCELVMEKPPKPTIHGLYVGLDYTNSTLRNLEGTINDANELAAAIQTRGKEMGVTVKTTLMLQNGNNTQLSPFLYPSKKHILACIETIDLCMSENDIFLFYFAGHGEENSGSIATAKIETKEYELLSVDELKAKLAAVKGTKLLILDSCYSGSHLIDYPGDATDKSQVIIETGYDPHQFYLLSASATQSSEEILCNGHIHGYFTAYLLEGLGWHHDKSTSLSVTNEGTEVVDTEEYEIVGHIPKNSIAPAQHHGMIRVGDLYADIPSAQLYNQTPQTGRGPLDMVLFSEKW